MAALICNGLCSIVTIPCRIISNVCTSFCDVTGTLCSGPFCMYSITALALNLPPIISTGETLSNGFSESKGSSWLFINMICCISNIGSAFYISRSLQNRNGAELQRNTTVLSRALHLLCYDPLIALYILILIFHFCWLGTGAAWKFSDRIDDSVALNISIACGYSFFSVGCIALCCSLCVACCCGGRNSTDDTTYRLLNDGNESQTQEQNSNSANSTQLFTDLINDIEAAQSCDIPLATPVYNQAGEHATEVLDPEPSAPTLHSGSVGAAAVIVQPEPSAPPLYSKGV